MVHEFLCPKKYYFALLLHSDLIYDVTALHQKQAFMEEYENYSRFDL